MKPPVSSDGAEEDDDDTPDTVSNHDVEAVPIHSFATEISYHDVTHEVGSGASFFSPDAMKLPDPFGKFKVEKMLGHGAMGAVFLAHDTSLNRPVALKVPFLTRPQPEMVRSRFLREAQAVAKLQHPNICQIYEINEISNIPYICMRFVDGQPLSQKLDWAYDMDRAMTIVRKVALALHDAHENRIIHRDVKSGNIMIDRRNEPVVMDFGLARREDIEGSPITADGDMMGTPGYMSPEQFKGALSDIGPACDIYGLGIVLYECLTGKIPFRGTLFQILWHITNSVPEAPSEVRPELDRRLDGICLKAIAKNPGDRYASMLEFADALEEVIVSRRTPEVTSQTLGRLTLCIEGTEFAYQPSPSQTSITLGRKKRRPGEPPEEGNDIVLRTSDSMSCVRISRRHGEIRRDRDGYVYIDYSKTGTTHNGQRVERERPVRLRSGDRLVIANAITLIVKLDAGTMQFARSNGVSLPNSSAFFEADVGNIVTMEWSTENDFEARRDGENFRTQFGHDPNDNQDYDPRGSRSRPRR